MQTVPAEHDPSLSESPRSTSALATRLLGIAVLLIGLWAMLGVVGTAMKLFDDQSAVVKIADGIEARMHLNAFLKALIAQRLALPTSGNQAPDVIEATNALQTVDLVFILAQFAVLTLLSVIGKIAIRMVRTGGELALHNEWEIRQTRRLLQELGASIRGPAWLQMVRLKSVIIVLKAGAV